MKRIIKPLVSAFVWCSLSVGALAYPAPLQHVPRQFKTNMWAPMADVPVVNRRLLYPQYIGALIRVPNLLYCTAPGASSMRAVAMRLVSSVFSKKAKFTPSHTAPVSCRELHKTDEFIVRKSVDTYDVRVRNQLTGRFLSLRFKTLSVLLMYPYLEHGYILYLVR